MAEVLYWISTFVLILTLLFLLGYQVRTFIHSHLCYNTNNIFTTTLFFLFRIVFIHHALSCFFVDKHDHAVTNSCSSWTNHFFFFFCFNSNWFFYFNFFTSNVFQYKKKCLYSWISDLIEGIRTWNFNWKIK